MMGVAEGWLVCVHVRRIGKGLRRSSEAGGVSGMKQIFKVQSLQDTWLLSSRNLSTQSSRGRPSCPRVKRMSSGVMGEGIS